jgi:hypothetical protein
VPRSSRPSRWNFGERVGRFFAGQQHGVAEVATALGVGEELVAQDALVDLDAQFLRLLELGLGADLGLGRHEPGHRGGGVVDQPLDAHELAPVVGQPVVEHAGMLAQEGKARLARGLLVWSGAPVGTEGRGVGRELAAGRDRL